MKHKNHRTYNGRPILWLVFGWVLFVLGHVTVVILGSTLRAAEPAFWIADGVVICLALGLLGMGSMTLARWCRSAALSIVCVLLLLGVQIVVGGYLFFLLTFWAIYDLGPFLGIPTYV